jgi:methyl-accepting chemotaxis protein
VVVALILTISILFVMFKLLISNRLKEVHSALEDIAEGEGDLSQRLNENPQDEIGVVAVAFNKFVRKLSTAMKQINTQVEQLTQTTESMAKITQKTQQDVSQQNNVTEHIASSMTSMMMATEEMTAIASNTAENTKTTQQATVEGQKVVQNNLKSVGELSQMIQEVSLVVSNLETDSQNIGGVLDVIRGIADQTNLLALNAAIEAARAGEQGRGFAVVADEVRTLASRTQESTEEINKMIEQLQLGVKNAVQTIQRSNSSIEKSEKHANETNEMIGLVGSSISAIQEQNISISNAAEAQGTINQEINTNIDNIKDVSQSTSESTEELLSLAQEINNATNTISKQLQKFTH